MRAVTLPCSFGEAADKITILQIKSARIRDPEKLKSVRHELGLATEALFASIEISDTFEALMTRLKDVNETLWQIEDDIRVCERGGDFGPDFVTLARSVYRLNDQRAAIKRDINLLLGSELREEKSYGP